MLSVADELAANIEAAILGVACQPDRVYVIAGEPPAPTDHCREIAVWVDEIRDQNEGDTTKPCLVVSQLTVRYRIQVCYTEKEDGTDQTEAQHYVTALCLYPLMTAIWCGLITARHDGTLAGAGDCDNTSLGALRVDQRSGGYVSATGSITVDYDCVLGS